MVEAAIPREGRERAKSALLSFFGGGKAKRKEASVGAYCYHFTGVTKRALVGLGALFPYP